MDCACAWHLQQFSCSSNRPVRTLHTLKRHCVAQMWKEEFCDWLAHFTSIYQCTVKK